MPKHFVTFDESTEPLDEALEFWAERSPGDVVLVAALCTSQPEAHPRLRRDWCKGKLSWNQLVNAVQNSDEYERIN